MDNYVILYHFEDKESEERFEHEIREEFWRHQVEENDGFKYFGFAGKEEPGVVDKVNNILATIGIGTKDYVALYHSGGEDGEQIKRTMLIGHDSLVETKVKEISFDSHRNSLTKLLDFDYVKAQPQAPEKTR